MSWKAVKRNQAWCAAGPSKTPRYDFLFHLTDLTSGRPEQQAGQQPLPAVRSRCGCCVCVCLQWPERVFRCDSPVTALDFSFSNPSQLAMGMQDGTIAIYNIHTKACMVTSMWGPWTIKYLSSLNHWFCTGLDFYGSFMSPSGGDCYYGPMSLCLSFVFRSCFLPVFFFLICLWLVVYFPFSLVIYSVINSILTGINNFQHFCTIF